MDIIVEYLDVILVSLITGVSGYIISGLNHKRDKKKEYLDRERKYIDEYVDVIMDLETYLINVTKQIKELIPDNNDIYVGVHKYKPSKPSVYRQEAGILAKSEYSYKLFIEISGYLNSLYDIIDTTTSYQSGKSRNNEVRETILNYEKDIESLFNEIRVVTREFYRNHF